MSVPRRAVVAAVCRVLVATKGGHTPSGVKEILGRFRPLFEGRKRKQDKRALSSAEHICPQCGQGAGLRVLSPAAILRGGAVTFPASPLFSSAEGSFNQEKRRYYE